MNETPDIGLGWRHLPAILPQSDSLHTLLWDYLAFTFFALILLHLAAALFHALVRRDGAFEAMAWCWPAMKSHLPNKIARWVGTKRAKIWMTMCAFGRERDWGPR